VQFALRRPYQSLSASLIALALALYCLSPAGTLTVVLFLRAGRERCTAGDISVAAALLLQAAVVVLLAELCMRADVRQALLQCAKQRFAEAKTNTQLIAPIRCEAKAVVLRARCARI
jgi:hypothetical protein